MGILLRKKGARINIFNANKNDDFSMTILAYVC